MNRLLPVIFSLTLLQVLSGVDGKVAPSPTILTKSPFLPPDFQPPGTPGQATEAPKGIQSYEFRGVYELGGTFHYNLYSTSDKKGNWITEQTAEAMGFKIIRFDSDKDSLEILLNGEPVALSLIETSDKPMPVQRASTRQAKAGKPTAKKTQARRRVIRPTTRAKNTTTKTTQRRVVSRPPSTP